MQSTALAAVSCPVAGMARLMAGNVGLPALVMFAGPQPRESPRRSATLNGDEAPPCMRWRGLALPRGPSYRLLSCRVLRGVPPVSASRRPRQSPGPSSVPLVSLGADPVFSGEEFLLPTEAVAQGLSARSSRFFSHPQDICCLSSVHGRFPPSRSQVYPQHLRMTGVPEVSECSSWRAPLVLSAYWQLAQREFRSWQAMLTQVSPPTGS